MAAPRLTFFCELEAVPLQNLMTDACVSTLADLKASISLAMLDFSPERAEVIRRLNGAGIPVTAWLLLEREKGYWCNLDNILQVGECYNAFQAWSQKQGLVWKAVGLDIEPDLREMEQLADGYWRLIPRALRRSLRRKGLKPVQRAYRELVSQIHADGYPVESYQFPLIADERKARSTLLQRTTRVVDVAVDREVWMLYTSYFRPKREDALHLGLGILGSYGPEAQAIGLGSTGGGVDAGALNSRPLTWDELARDLRLAWHWCDSLYVFSLEGCIEQGFLDRLKNFQWDQPILLPDRAIKGVEAWRDALQSFLWLGERVNFILTGLLGALWSFTVLRRLLSRRKVPE